MEKDTTFANIFTLGAVGLTVMNAIQVLTILSLATAIILNVVMIYKNTKNEQE